MEIGFMKNVEIICFKKRYNKGVKMKLKLNIKVVNEIKTVSKICENNHCNRNFTIYSGV